MLALLLVISVMPMAAFAEGDKQTLSGNLLKITTDAVFQAGILKNLKLCSGVPPCRCTGGKVPCTGPSTAQAASVKHHAKIVTSRRKSILVILLSLQPRKM